MESLEWIIRMTIAVIFAYYLVADILGGGDFSRDIGRDIES
jgi:hypothetical protein